MTHDASGDGLWTLVALNSALFLIFAFSFFKPQTGEAAMREQFGTAFEAYAADTPRFLPSWRQTAAEMTT